MRYNTRPRDRPASRSRRLRAIGLGLAVCGLAACGAGDNPVALADLNPVVEFGFGATEIETFEDVTVEVAASANGEPVEMLEARFEVMSPTGMSREVRLEADEHGYGVSLMFFEEGQHSLHLRGMPGGHGIDAAMGEISIHVMRRHEVIGPFWVELEVEPAPVIVGGTAAVRLFVYDLLPGGGRGAAAAGVALGLEVHDPDAIAAGATVTESNPGEYEAEVSFPKVGLYEFRVEITVDADIFDGEFHMPVFDLDGTRGDSVGGGDGGGGGGHHHGGGMSGGQNPGEGDTGLLRSP